MPVDEEALEQETEYTFMASMQSMRYDVMFGRAPAEEIDPEEMKEQIRQDLIREQKEAVILRSIIEQEEITASGEELQEEAESMAKRQDTTLEMIRSFFGEDLKGLAGEVQRRKAKDFLYGQCR